MSGEHHQANGDTTSFHKCGLALIFILAILVTGLRPAVANDSPVISGNTATYSGNQQPNPIVQNGTSIYTINVQNLTTNVGSSSTDTSISLTNTGSHGSDHGDDGGGSKNLLLNYSGGTYYLYGNHFGACVNTIAGSGHDGSGNGAFDQHGGDGGDGGTGGTATITTSGAVQVSGITAAGIGAYSDGGAAGDGGDSNGALNEYGGDGGDGGAAGTVTVTTNGAVTVAGVGIVACSIGGDGGEGGDAGTEAKAEGGDGGKGGNGGAVNVTANASVITTGNNASGIRGFSEGGAGGEGGRGGGEPGKGGVGGAGGAGGNVTVNTYTGAISTSGVNCYGILAQSLGGAGGEGGEGNGSFGGNKGGAGGIGGNGGGVLVNNNDTITTSGSGAHGIYAQSAGGTGGAGGSSSGGTGDGGNGNTGGGGGTVTVTGNGAITTSGDNAHGIYAQSGGGQGGAGGQSKAGGGDGGDGAGGGAGGTVTVTGNGVYLVQGNNAYGIVAQSNGGAGGSGASAQTGTSADGGTGGTGGAGAQVTVTNTAAGYITASAGFDILAQSVGGAGGSGGYGGGTSGKGGKGGAGGAGGNVGVTNDGTLTSWGGDAHAIKAQSLGGAGGTGATGGGVSGKGGDGGTGGNAGGVTVTNNGTISTTNTDACGISALSTGGAGGTGGQGNGAGGNGGDAGAGGTGGSVTVVNTGYISTHAATGIDAESIGGAGHNGGAGYGISGIGGNGNNGGASGQVTVNVKGNIITDEQHYAVNAVSTGGAGGSGGDAGGVNGMGGNAGKGGNSTMSDGSNIVNVTVDSGIMLKGGILASSTGGAGGKGHSSVGVGAEGGNGGSGGNGGAVHVDNNGIIQVSGVSGVSGILAQSIGGIGGTGGDAKAAGDSAGNGGDGGAGGTVQVTGSGSITVSGDNVYGILAQSQGGSGGSGGNAYGGVPLPGDAGASGIAGAVTVSTTGGISTSGTDSCGILAQSLGGVGGGGGGGYGLIAWGGAVSGGATGGAVTVNTGTADNHSASIITQGAGAIAIFAQSVGGGGGNGGTSGGVVGLGSSGAAGGDGGTASVTNYLTLTTYGNSAHGIEAQSLGGGGGNGGGAVSVAAGFGVSVGGSGGSGGSGQQVIVANSGGISTSGTSACGILAQSLGGGGGNGDYSINAGGGVVQFGMGGSGGDGGVGGSVTVSNSGRISTTGGSSYGILAQSLGGGGGAGVFNITEGASLEEFGIGGSGGSGGRGGTVSVTSSNAISTSGGSAVGILAQSLGGGGGSSGGSLTAGAAIIMCGIGGTGGSGGSGSEVDVGSSGTPVTGSITTLGANAQGILAQSVGGGGGNGGWDVTAGLGATVGVGGSGGTGGDGGVVKVYSGGTIITNNDSAQGILAQSLGGGGGNGGFSFAGNLTPILSASFSLGGSGNTAGNGAAVTVSNTGSIATGSIITNSDGTRTVLGSKAHGIFAQSVGGGGGNAGWSGTGTISFSVPDVPVSASTSVSLGGSGGSGGNGGGVTVNNLAPSAGSSTIGTVGDYAYGIFAQSIGGGGGSGGGSVAAALNFSVPESLGITCPIAVGGQGGDGGTGGQVTVVNQDAITTLGEGSLGILAQSIGGGGGDAGWSVSTSLSGAATDSCTIQGTAAVGGSGGSGGSGGAVQVTNTGVITTGGQSAIGIEAQSVGGGGGNGGWSVSGDALLGKTNGINFGVTMGGSGGSGGNGGTVTVTNGQSGDPAAAAITTSGDYAIGILAQSIGGGGGNGGEASSYSLRGGIGANTTCSFTASVTVGGSGGVGGSGAQVTVTNDANILTAGTKSYGIEAQSVGGGGGNGGAGSSVTLSSSATKDEEQTMVLPNANITGTAAVGGSGGNGNNGGAVSVGNTGNITTQGIQAYGIFAQSVGGGGGEGGESYDFSIVAALSKAGNAKNEASGLNLKETVSVGGNGGGASSGGTVTVNNSGAVNTSGSSAYGIFAQSVGGGGGAGGESVSGIEIPAEGYNSWKSWLIPSGDFTVKVGGSGGSCGDGGQITVNNSGAIATSGDGAHGIYAQSLGGGGGVASYDQSQMFTDAENNGGGIDKGMTFEFLIGGTGGAAGNGGVVQVTNSGEITTTGEQADGIFAQSIGGGGGSASVHGGPWHGINFMQYFGMAVNIGRSGGGGGSGGAVTVTNTADITTRGNNSNGIFAQSVGGAGGSGSETTQYLQGFLWNGSFLSGAGGNGGAVTVSQTGNIFTYGQDAHGIVAQSIAGQDQAGKVTVTLNDPVAAAGNIIASGLGSSGIVAQSLGAGGNNDINITINQPISNTGLVQGGSSGTVTNADGSTITYNAYGVLIMDGKQNTLTNHGSISTLDGATGTAVMVQTSYGSHAWGDLTINNYGTITGSVNQGTQAASSLNNGLSLPDGKSNITINNYQDATLNAGPVINLGDGTLTNRGLFSLGTMRSALTGNYTQTGSGMFQVMLGNYGSCGRLNVSGTANLGGTLQVGLNNTTPLRDGTGYSFLTGNFTGGFSDVLLPHSTPLVSFSVEYTGSGVQSGVQSSDQTAAAGDAVRIVSHVNKFISVASGEVQTVIGRHLDDMMEISLTGRFPEILAEFQKLDVSQFNAAFESFTPSIYGANTDTTFAITRQYGRTLQQRMSSLRSIRQVEAAPQVVPGRPSSLPGGNGSNIAPGLTPDRGWDGSGGNAERLGFWLEGFGQFGDQGALNRVSGYDYGLGGTGFGVDYAFTRNLILGANFGYSYTDLDMDNRAGGGKINSLYGSAYGTWFTDRAYVEGVFTYGNHQYDDSRRVNIGSLQSVNDSSHTGNAYSMLTEAGYKFPVRQWNLQPFASISYCNLDEDRIKESGELMTMEIGNRSTDSVVSEMGVQVDRSVKTSKGTLVPMVRAGWQHDFGVSDNKLPVSFVDDPAGTVTVPLPRASEDRAVVRAGLTFKAAGGITSSIQYVGEVGEKTQGHGIAGEFRISF